MRIQFVDVKENSEGHAPHRGFKYQSAKFIGELQISQVLKIWHHALAENVLHIDSRGHDCGCVGRRPHTPRAACSGVTGCYGDGFG